MNNNFTLYFKKLNKMTTTQIIILSILFIFDFSISIIKPVYKNDFITPLLQTIRICFIWTAIVLGILDYNRLTGKCPEYEQIQEPIYKRKS